MALNHQRQKPKFYKSDYYRLNRQSVSTFIAFKKLPIYFKKLFCQSIDKNRSNKSIFYKFYRFYQLFFFTVYVFSKYSKGQVPPNRNASDHLESGSNISAA